MSGLTPSSLTPGVQKRILVSPRNAHNLKLHLASVDEKRSGLYALGLVSPLTELMSSSPSQLQPLTPALNGRQAAGANSSWTLSSNLLSTSKRRACSPPSSSNAYHKSKTKGAPALEIVSPLSTSADGASNTSAQGRSSLPDLSTRKDPQLSSVEVSAERCTLSPSSAGGGHSLAFTPTFEASNSNSMAPHRASTSTHNEVTATPPPNAPRNYSKRSGGSRNSVPPPQQAFAPALRTTAPSTNLESPTRHGARDETSPLRRTWHNTSSTNHNNSDSSTYARTEDTAMEYDVPRVGLGLPEYSRYPHATATTTTAMAALPLLAQPVASGASPATSPSAPKTPAVGPRGRSTQMGSILATSAQNGAVSTNPGKGGFNGSSTSAHTSSNRSSNARGRSARGPHLTTHLFLDGSTQDSGSPASGLQSPALTEARRKGSRGGNGRSLLRSSRGSSEGRTSVSTESSNACLTFASSAARPNALNFARGELIGKGSFGAVYRGMQRTTNQIICMKEIRLPGGVEEIRRVQQKSSGVAEDATPRGGPATPPPPPPPQSLSPASAAAETKEKAALAKQMESVKRELALLKQLNHPNIVKYLNDEVVDGHLRIYMEYVAGGSVASALKTYGSFQEPQAAALCLQLLRGLSYLHGHGIVHRDLKGDNLLLETTSVLKIADFGTAKNTIASATMTANIVGTAYFMAPEVLRPDGLSGTPADIWSAGCCVIEMLTGKPPLSDIPNQYSVMMTIAGSPKVPLEKYIPSDNTWSPEVLNFIKQCLRLNASTRPTAVELLHHPWILQHCDADVLSAATPATATSSLTPTLAPMDSPCHSPSAATGAGVAPRRPRSPDPPLTPSSTDAVRTTAATPTVSPRLAPRGGSAERSDVAALTSSASRERKAKREKKASTSRRQVPRDPNTDHSSNTGGGDSSNRRDESVTPRTAHATPNPPAAVGATTTHGIDGTTTTKFHPALTRPTADLFARSHYTGGQSNLSTREDDSQQSFSYDYPLLSPSRPAELCLQSSGAFLPAIPGAPGSAVPPASVTASMDSLRAQRLSRPTNVATSRDDTRAYHYPNDEDTISRGSMRGGGRDFFLDAHDCGREATDGLVQYGSTTRLQLPEAVALERGLYSTLDCLTVPPAAEDLSPATTSRRSTSKRTAGRGTL